MILSKLHVPMLHKSVYTPKCTSKFLKIGRVCLHFCKPYISDGVQSINKHVRTAWICVCTAWICVCYAWVYIFKPILTKVFMCPGLHMLAAGKLTLTKSQGWISFASGMSAKIFAEIFFVLKPKTLKITTAWGPYRYCPQIIELCLYKLELGKQQKNKPSIITG